MSKIDDALNKAEDSFGVDATPNDVASEFVKSLDRIEVAKMLANDRSFRVSGTTDDSWEFWSKSSQSEFLMQADAVLYYMADIG